MTWTISAIAELDGADEDANLPSGTGGRLFVISLHKDPDTDDDIGPVTGGDWTELFIGENSGDSDRMLGVWTAMADDSPDLTWAADPDFEYTALYCLRASHLTDASPTLHAGRDGGYTFSASTLSPADITGCPTDAYDAFSVLQGNHDGSGVSWEFGTALKDTSGEWTGSSWKVNSGFNLVVDEDSADGATYAPPDYEDDGSGAWNVVTIICTRATAVLAWEQTHFQLRNDDGSETTATDMEAEDTNTTLSPGDDFRLRMQADSTGAAPGSVTPTVEYRRKGGPDRWREVPT